MRTITQFIRQSLSWKLSLGIILMAMPIFMLALGVLFVQSRNQLKKEATEHASSVLNTTMQRVSRFMNTLETATDINDWEIVENLDPDSLLNYSRFVVSLNGNIDGCSISTEPNIFPKYQSCPFFRLRRRGLLFRRFGFGGSGLRGLRALFCPGFRTLLCRAVCSRLVLTAAGGQ